MAHRFFLPDFPSQDTVTLDGDQAHHAAQVMRFEVGDSIILFDGQGTEATCEINAISRKRVELTIKDRNTADRALSAELTMAVALPKKDRQKFLVEKLVELGVDRLIPVQAERSVAEANPKVIERIKKQVIEACKQCERNRLMQITDPMNFSQIAAWSDQYPQPARRWLADPYHGVSIATVNQQTAGDANNSDQGQHELVMIGPEGGFSDQEITDATDAGFQLLRIGPRFYELKRPPSPAPLFSAPDESNCSHRGPAENVATSILALQHVQYRKT